MNQVSDSICIRRAEPQDFSSIWEIFHPIVKAGDTWAYAPDTTQEQARAIWFDANLRAYVALLNNEILGMYFLRPSQPGLGSHVANAGYMVSSRARSQGIGARMCEHSLAEARQLGYQAMQFNFVVSTNQKAVALWQRMGFSIIGTIPRGYQHLEKGLVDAYIMHRFLN